MDVFASPVAEVVGEGDGGAQRERDVAAERHSAGQGDRRGHLRITRQRAERTCSGQQGETAVSFLLRRYNAPLT